MRILIYIFLIYNILRINHGSIQIEPTRRLAARLSLLFILKSSFFNAESLIQLAQRYILSSLSICIQCSIYIRQSIVFSLQSSIFKLSFSILLLATSLASSCRSQYSIFNRSHSIFNLLYSIFNHMFSIINGLYFSSTQFAALDLAALIASIFFSIFNRVQSSANAAFIHKAASNLDQKLDSSSPQSSIFNLQFKIFARYRFARCSQQMWLTLRLSLLLSLLLLLLSVSRCRCRCCCCLICDKLTEDCSYFIQIM